MKGSPISLPFKYATCVTFLSSILASGIQEAATLWGHYCKRNTLRILEENGNSEMLDAIGALHYVSKRQWAGFFGLVFCTECITGS